MMTILPLASSTTESAEVRSGAARRSTADASARRSARLEPTRLGRALIVTGAFLLGALITALVMLAVIPQASAGDAPETITVQQGQTLWGIAQEHAPEGTDLRDYVLEAQRINDLTTERVSAGQELELPGE